MFITQRCSEFLVLRSEKRKKKKRCCCVYFVLALLLHWLGTNLLSSAKYSLHRAPQLYLLVKVFTLLVFYFRACGEGGGKFTLILHCYAQTFILFYSHKVSESRFSSPKKWKILSELYYIFLSLIYSDNIYSFSYFFHCVVMFALVPSA